MTDIKEAQGLEVVGFVVLGGVFHGGSGPELGDIDIEPDMGALERIQYELVDSSDDVIVPLCSLPKAKSVIDQLRAELAALKASPVVMPERLKVPMPIWKDVRQPYGDPLNAVRIGEATHFNLAIDEFERLNAAAPKAEPQPVSDDIRCKCCGYLVTDSEHRGCLRSAEQISDDVRDAARYRWLRTQHIPLEGMLGRTMLQLGWLEANK